MQISKSFLVLCAAVYCTALVPLRAADTEAQIKAREAMQKKLAELQAQSSAVTAPQLKAPAAAPTVAAPAVAAPAPKKRMAEPLITPDWRTTPPAQWTPPPVPALQASPTVVRPKPALVAPQPVDSESIARAREALRQRMAELQAQPAQAAPQPTVAAPLTPAPAVAAPVVATPPVAQPTTQAVFAAPTPADPGQITMAQQALDAKMKELAVSPPPQPATPLAPAPSQKPPKKTTADQVLQSFPPLQGPPPALPASKQQRLDELLVKYRADQVTPEEYHRQRAAILAEP